MPFIDCKIVLLGESSVGKTCIIQRYKNKKFTDEHLVTVGASHEVKDLKINDKDVRVKIWDTCGNEQFRSITKIFYQGADIAILVYDITNQKSFDELKNYWYNEIKENTDTVQVIVVIGNKCDLLENEVVSEVDAIQFAEEINADYGKTSALSGVGIEDVLNNAITKFVDFISSQKLSEYRFTFNDTIKDLKDTKNEKEKCKC